MQPAVILVILVPEVKNVSDGNTAGPIKKDTMYTTYAALCSISCEPVQEI